VSVQIDYRRWLSEVKKSNSKYKSLFVEERVYPPIFFFGNPEGAVLATVGINPSVKEFSKDRKWGLEYSDSRCLFERCRNYFNNPKGVPAYDRYYGVWKNFLRNIGASYMSSPRAVHLDFSPRATRSMGSLQKKPERLLFLDLMTNDLKYFIKQLRAYRSIKYLYVAGSVTKKYYGIEFLEKNSGHLGYRLKHVMPFKRGGQGQVGLYKLDLADAILRYLFFCSTSPSGRIKLHPLPKRAHWLIKHYPNFLPSD